MFFRCFFVLVFGAYSFCHATLQFSYSDVLMSKLNWDLRYELLRTQDSPLGDLLPHLRRIAGECGSVALIGDHLDDSLWAVLKGISESPSPVRTCNVIFKAPLLKKMEQDIQRHAVRYGVACRFESALNPLERNNLILLDSLYSYDQLLQELESLEFLASKYIAILHSNDPRCLSETETRGPWQAIAAFLDAHEEWTLQGQYLYNWGLTVLKRRHPAALETFQNKIILCTGPSWRRRDLLKAATENDQKLIAFKKIFFSTNDLDLLDVSFKGEFPVCDLIPCRGHQLDCTNCIISSIRNAVNDPAISDEDIILFKHESVFINDMNLIRKAIGKILEGYDAVTRQDDYCLDMSDAFFIKVSAARALFQDRECIADLKEENCEEYLTHTVFNQLDRMYRVRTCRKYAHWEDNELGLFHILPQSREDRGFWDKKNYDSLFTNS